MPIASGVTLDHVARETADIKRFVNFYQELFGFEEIEAFDTVDGTKVIFLYLPGVFTLHVIEKSSVDSKPFSPPSIADFTDLPCAHHFCFTVTNYESFVQTLKEKGIQTFLSGSLYGELLLHSSSPDFKLSQ